MLNDMKRQSAFLMMDFMEYRNWGNYDMAR